MMSGTSLGRRKEEIHTLAKDTKDTKSSAAMVASRLAATAAEELGGGIAELQKRTLLS